jgi:hypothetical protein
MFICYFIEPVSGSVALQYSCSNECELIQEFKEDEEVASCEVISIDTDAEEYFTEDAYKDLAKHLWKKLGDVPTDEEGVDGGIDEDFLHFSKGTDVYDIWHWFESEFDVSVAEDLKGV